MSPTQARMQLLDLPASGREAPACAGFVTITTTTTTTTIIGTGTGTSWVRVFVRG